MPVLALIPSPLLGPAVWGPVVPELTRRRWEVAPIPALPRVPTCPQDVVDFCIAALPADRDIVLIPHSNAGLFAPLIAAALSVVGYVFVDAGLPPTTGTIPVADPNQLAQLAEKADGENVLPPWTTWWDPAERDALFPDDAVRARIEREQQRLPMTYFAGHLHIPPGWDDRPAAYLSFGDTYAKQREDAATRGWSVRELPGRHLHMLNDPDDVADAIDDALSRIGIAPEPAG